MLSEEIEVRLTDDKRIFSHGRTSPNSLVSCE